MSKKQKVSCGMSINTYNENCFYTKWNIRSDGQNTRDHKISSKNNQTPNQGPSIIVKWNCGSNSQSTWTSVICQNQMVPSTKNCKKHCHTLKDSINFGISAADSGESIRAPCFSEIFCKSSFTPAYKKFTNLR